MTNKCTRSTNFSALLFGINIIIFKLIPIALIRNETKYNPY